MWIDFSVEGGLSLRMKFFGEKLKIEIEIKNFV